MHPDEKTPQAVQFLRDAVAYYAGLGIEVHRVLTDNGSAFRSKDFASTCTELGIAREFTRAYRPQTTARPSASSSRHCASGLTAGPTRTLHSELGR